MITPTNYEVQYKRRSTWSYPDDQEATEQCSNEIGNFGNSDAPFDSHSISHAQNTGVALEQKNKSNKFQKGFGKDAGEYRHKKSYQ